MDLHYAGRNGLYIVVKKYLCLIFITLYMHAEALETNVKAGDC